MIFSDKRDEKKTIQNYVATQLVSIDKLHCKSVQEWILIGDPSLKIGGYD